MKEPNLFIVGAPKCGTSSLYYWLSEHPRIFMSDVKEPNFFASDMNSRMVRTLSRYERLFEDATDNHSVVGEASTGYLFSQEAVPKIESRCSDVKYIVMLRNPIEMAQSLHEQEVQCGVEHVMNFESAWKLSPKRRRGREVHFGCEDPKRLDYMKRCSLGSQLERILDIIPRRRILIMFLEDIDNNSKKEYEKCLKFLNVKSKNKSKFQVKNESKGTKYPNLRRQIRRAGRLRDIFKRMLGIDSSLGVGLFKIVNDKECVGRDRNIKESLEREMSRYFEEEISKIEKIMDRDLSHWIRIDDS